MPEDKKGYGKNVRIDLITFDLLKELVKETRHTIGGYVALAVLEKSINDKKKKK
jgi:hypothetical protein